MNTTELAAELNTTPRNLRKFLRSDARAADQPIAGKGSRWTIEPKKVPAMRKRFTAWQAAQVEAKAKRDAALAAATAEDATD